MKIGIIGIGVVGSAQRDLMRFLGHDVSTYDKFSNEKSNCNIDCMLPICEVIFLCLPTEQAKDGSINMSAFTDVMPQLKGYRGTVVIKSTVLPGTCNNLANEYNLNISHNPEFLTEVNAKFDSLFCDRVIVGNTHNTSSNKVVKVYQPLLEGNPKIKLIMTDSITSEMCKYANNLFLSMKVSFSNELKKISDTVGADYSTIKESLIGDERIGPTHFGVSDKGGFGGMCFPKDTSAFQKLCKDKGFSFKTLDATIEVNKPLRPEYYEVEK